MYCEKSNDTHAHAAHTRTTTTTGFLCDMGPDIATQLERLDGPRRLLVLLACASYPDTETVARQAPRVVETFDGSARGFAAAALRLQHNVELLALGTNLAVNLFLRTMATDDAFSTLGLDAVDKVVLRRCGVPVLWINRDDDTRFSPSGRSISIDIRDMPDEARRLLDAQDSAAANTRILWLVATLVACATLAAYLSRKCR